MTDEKDTSEAESSAAEPSQPQGGARLADARRGLQISVVEIAKELHLDEPKVHALERNEFDVLGAPVFAKGHLRKYAQLVRVDEKDVMADYYELTRAAGMPPLVTTRRKSRREMAPGPWIAVIIIVIVVASAYWWFTSRPPAVDVPPPQSVPQESAPATEPEEDSEEVADAVSDSDAVNDLSSESTDIAPIDVAPIEVDDSPRAAAVESDDSDVLRAAVGEAEPVVRQPPQLEDGQIRLLVTYRGDCWTEISDARGRRLFFDLGKDGRTVELSGEAPFNVLFGNADNVAIRVNGADRAINAAERRGRTARLTIAGT